MEFKQFGNKYILRLDKSEEIVATLKKFCQDQNITLGWVKGIGAVNRVKIGLFETAIKAYHSTILEGDFEITSLLGNISTMKGEVYLHLHINISDNEYKTYGGHLNEGVISATGEFLIESIEGTVERAFNEEAGLNLYHFD
ncbi:PPC domain-containing DNA-binding protein [Alkaliphilus transvaalensis]|uniref:PPC domain-containing DNA-binding protein n=1 Tax=Alkaliphilus transvaalensis TaxID=114628 RepID=UPI00047AECAB|nr:PPC domain-containing DNA-binding protein [Alkaliphilus transvaalensis]